MCVPLVAARLRVLTRSASVAGTPTECASGYYFNGFSPYSCVANIDPSTCTTPGKTVRDNACQDCTNGGGVATWSTTATCEAATCEAGYDVDSNSKGCSYCQNYSPEVDTWDTGVCQIKYCVRALVCASVCAC